MLLETATILTVWSLCIAVGVQNLQGDPQKIIKCQKDLKKYTNSFCQLNRIDVICHYETGFGSMSCVPLCDGVTYDSSDGDRCLFYCKDFVGQYCDVILPTVIPETSSQVPPTTFTTAGFSTLKTSSQPIKDLTSSIPLAWVVAIVCIGSVLVVSLVSIAADRYKSYRTVRSSRPSLDIEMDPLTSLDGRSVQQPSSDEQDSESTSITLAEEGEDGRRGQQASSDEQDSGSTSITRPEDGQDDDAAALDSFLPHEEEKHC